MSAQTSNAGGGQYDDLIFEWHRKKARENLRKHRVAFDEAKTIFADLNLLVAPDRDHSYDEIRYLAIGRSARDRLLTVCFTERGPVVRLISARRSEPWERREYELISKQE
jgi:uncharacterized protein